MNFNLRYEIFSETTSLFGAVLVVVVIFFMVRTRSYRRNCQSSSVGGLIIDSCICTKPIPEENEEKNCEVWPYWKTSQEEKLINSQQHVIGVHERR
ncbi:hypothetical protein ACROYT_G003014 [Oculina patagonica]